MMMSASRPKLLTVSLFGLTVPIPPWTVSGIGVLVLVAVAAWLYVKIAQTAPSLVSLREANAQLRAEVDEYGRHMADTPERALADPDGLVRVRIYADHCVLIERHGETGVRTKLVPDLLRSVALLPRAAGLVADVLPVVAAQGRCLDPHPGVFVTSYGAREGCWIEVWRRFADGCAHSQLFNSCAGYWDTNSDGTPRVKWVRCVH